MLFGLEWEVWLIGGLFLAAMIFITILAVKAMHQFDRRQKAIDAQFANAQYDYHEWIGKHGPARGDNTVLDLVEDGAERFVFHKLRVPVTTESSKTYRQGLYGKHVYHIHLVQRLPARGTRKEKIRHFNVIVNEEDRTMLLMSLREDKSNTR